MESYRIVNKVPTKILAFGKNVGDDLSYVKHLVLVIPGNPGVIDFYWEFMKETYERLKSKYPNMHIPVWGISHAGHQTEGYQDSTFPNLNENPELYNLNGQYDHKVRFIETFIPPHISAIGIGHSIGCKMWLEIMKRLDESTNNPVGVPKERHTVSKVFMLFPAIERIQNSPHGQRLSGLVKCDKVLTPFLWLVATLLPTSFQRWLVNFNLNGKDVPESIRPSALQLFNYDILKTIVYLGKDEMKQVVNLDTETLAKYLDKLEFHFGATDGWCPLSYVDEMKQQFPQLNYILLEKGYDHEFVIEKSAGMAGIVCEQITHL